MSRPQIILQTSLPRTTHEAIDYSLSRYPELKDTTIILKEKDLKYTMTAFPYIRRLDVFDLNFSRGNKCAYPLMDLAVDEQVGCIAHELYHIIEYLQMDRTQRINFGVKYLFSEDFRREVEYRVELGTMLRGFDKEVLAFVENYFATLSPQERTHKERVYPGPQMLRLFFAQHSKQVDGSGLEELVA